jgi:type II secretory pathway component PulJ
MMQHKPRLHTRAFTLVEVMVATTMTAFLFLMISGMWVGMAGSTNDSLIDASISQEAHFVLEVLRRDLGGFLPGQEKEEQDVNKLVGRLTTGANQLMLCFDGGKKKNDPVNGEPYWGKPDTVVVYEVQNEHLLRIEQAKKVESIVVASNVTSFSPTQLANGVRVEFTITHEGISKTYTLISQDP